MSKKRKGDADSGRVDPAPMVDRPDRDSSKKRKREVDVELVKVYDDLADEQENVRLAAAHTLLTKIYKPGTTDDGQIKTILTRLFRGLCSSRKSARLGFSVALTELLSQLNPTKSKLITVSVPEITDILEAQSAPETGTSGQDERDHYFGRVFGADAMLKSGLLFEKVDETCFGRLIELLCALALKKPWLRQECGWVLFNCVTNENNQLPEKFAVNAVERLAANKLIRTPEGVAVWLATKKRFPKAKLPTSAWKSGDPLSRKDVTVLADILKDARAHPDQQDSELSAQGSARWSASLHFSWDIVLAETFRDAPVQARSGKHGKSATSADEKLSFDLFWHVVVDESLFSNASSAERRAWGFSLWKKVFETAPQDLLACTFTPQAIRYLVNSLKSSERLLQKSAQRVTQSIQNRLTAADDFSAAGKVAAAYVRALLQGVQYGDFDQITKSKTLQNLINLPNPPILGHVESTLSELIREDRSKEEVEATLSVQRTAIMLQWKIVSARLRYWEQSRWSGTKDIVVDDWELVSSTLEFWLREICISTAATIRTTKGRFQPVLLPQAREFAKERLNLAFEQGLKLGPLGCEILASVLLDIHRLEADNIEMATTFEHDIQTVVQAAWRKLSAVRIESRKTSTTEKPSGSSTKGPAQVPSLSASQALLLLYCLLLFQIYSGEPEAVQILQEVLEHDAQSGVSKSNGQLPAVKEGSADSIMEILLSFASRPSKLLRRITTQIFDAFAPHLTIDGLEALCRVLETKENLQGQQEMFQAEDVDIADDGESGSDSDVEEADSDVEFESASADNSSGDESAGTSSSEQEGDDNEENEELAKFDAALASALGTRSLNQNDLAAVSDTSESGSDEDMDDDQMAELDTKLAEVFRARNEQQSKNKKKDAKEAKENIVNFKNRVLDLIESYFKHQQQNPLALDLLLPVLRLARTTQTKQLADRSCNIVQQFCSRCKGSNVPDLGEDPQNEHAIDILKSVHEEASQDTSNAQSNVTSLSSILVVKALVKADSTHIKTIVEVYASTRIRQLTEKKCRVLPGFFTDWNNWCQTAKEKLES